MASRRQLVRGCPRKIVKLFYFFCIVLSYHFYFGLHYIIHKILLWVELGGVGARGGGPVVQAGTDKPGAARDGEGVDGPRAQQPPEEDSGSSLDRSGQGKRRGVRCP